MTVSAPVLADVGPPPSCPDGKTRIYDQGYKCVDGPTPSQPTTASATATATASPTATATATATATSTETAAPTSEPAASASPPEDVPPSSRGCSCDVPERSVGSAGAAALVALAAGLALRRRKR